MPRRAGARTPVAQSSAAAPAASSSVRGSTTRDDHRGRRGTRVRLTWSRKKTGTRIQASKPPRHELESVPTVHTVVLNSLAAVITDNRQKLQEAGAMIIQPPFDFKHPASLLRDEDTFRAKMQPMPFDLASYDKEGEAVMEQFEIAPNAISFGEFKDRAIKEDKQALGDKELNVAEVERCFWRGMNGEVSKDQKPRFFTYGNDIEARRYMRENGVEVTIPVSDEELGLENETRRRQCARPEGVSETPMRNSKPRKAAAAAVAAAVLIPKGRRLPVRAARQSKAMDDKASSTKTEDAEMTDAVKVEWDAKKEAMRVVYRVYPPSREAASFVDAEVTRKSADALAVRHRGPAPEPLSPTHISDMYTDGGNVSADEADVTGDFGGDTPCKRINRRVLCDRSEEARRPLLREVDPRPGGADVGSVNRSSLLRHLPAMPGINVPMFYAGARMTRFCWHVEDGNLCSIGYLHKGSKPKVWYVIAEEYADRFERFAQKKFAKAGLPTDAGMSAASLLQWKTSMFDPAELMAAGIKVRKMVQHAGQFIVTAPRAHHCGINTGFNLLEAVNYCPTFWLHHGRASAKQARMDAQGIIVPHEMLLAREAEAIYELAKEYGEQALANDKAQSRRARTVARELWRELRKGEKAAREYQRASGARILTWRDVHWFAKELDAGAQFGDDAGIYCDCCSHMAHFYVAVCFDCSKEKRARCRRHLGRVCTEMGHETVVVRRYSRARLYKLIQCASKIGGIWSDTQDEANLCRLIWPTMGKKPKEEPGLIEEEVLDEGVGMVGSRKRRTSMRRMVKKEIKEEIANGDAEVEEVSEDADWQQPRRKRRRTGSRKYSG